MAALLERLRALRSDDKTLRLTLISLTAAIAVVAAFVALPGSDDEMPAAGGVSTSEPETRARPGSSPQDDPDTRAAADDGVSSAVVTAPSEDPGDGRPSEVTFSESEVKVGITYTEDAGAANEAAGFTVGQVDQRRGWEALIADINRDPPFGRKVVPVWYSQTENEVSSKGGERVAQEACAHFTQDNEVFMVWVGTIGAGEDTLSACLTKAKIPQVAFGVGTSYSRTFEDFPYLVEPASAAMDRMAAFYVDGLEAQGFFSGFKDNAPPYTPQPPADGQARIGLIRYDQPSHVAGAAALKERLGSHGLSLCEGCEFEISFSSTSVPEQLDDATEINAAIQNCKGRPGGPCTHMLFLGSTAQRIPVFFMDGAERQQYRPRLGLSPLDDWRFVRDFLGPSSDAQFRRSQIVTWDPVAFSARPEAYERCKEIFQDAGETFEGDEAAGKEAMIAAYCDTAWYHAAAMEAAGPSLNLASWMDGVESMAPVPGAGAFVMQTGPNRHDGVGAIRVGEWSEDCSCYEPASGIVDV